LNTWYISSLFDTLELTGNKSWNWKQIVFNDMQLSMKCTLVCAPPLTNSGEFLGSILSKIFLMIGAKFWLFAKALVASSGEFSTLSVSFT
jgi:hypothetical protein